MKKLSIGVAIATLFTFAALARNQTLAVVLEVGCPGATYTTIQAAVDGQLKL